MTNLTEWLLATRNAGKLLELRPLVTDAGITVVDLGQAGIPESGDEERIECFETFEENALAKARYFSARAGGRPVVADDSGLVVRALGGAPGVRSRRWSGAAGVSGHALDRANNARLADAMRGQRDRAAQFVCAVAWRGEGTEVVVRGEVEGTIVDRPSGEHGFGYDPYFFVDDLGMTLADATRDQKAAVSHRGRAFAALVAQLRAVGLLG